MGDHILHQCASIGDFSFRNAVGVGDLGIAEPCFLNHFIHRQYLNKLTVLVQQTKPLVNQRSRLQVRYTAGDNIDNLSSYQFARNSYHRRFISLKQQTRLVINPAHNRMKLPEILRGRPGGLIHIFLHTVSHLFHAECLVIRNAECFTLGKRFFWNKCSQTAFHIWCQFDVQARNSLQPFNRMAFRLIEIHKRLIQIFQIREQSLIGDNF